MQVQCKPCLCIYALHEAPSTCTPILLLIIGTKSPLLLSATKSRMGHAEPAAAGLGIANLTTMLGHLKVNPITLLRQVCQFRGCHLNVSR